MINRFLVPIIKKAVRKRLGRDIAPLNTMAEHPDILVPYAKFSAALEKASLVPRHLKALGVPGAFHDHERPLQHRRDPGDEFARVPSIRPDALQSREAGDQRRQDRFGPVAVLDPCRVHHHHQKPSEDIDHDMALASADALTAVIAAAPPFSVVLTV